MAVDLGLVLVGGAVGGLQEFVEGHGPAETPGFEGCVRQRHVTTSFLTADLGRRASPDALTEFEEFQRHDLGVGCIELELVGPDSFAAEEFGCKWFQPVRRGMFEDFRSGDWVVAGEVQGDRFAISVAGGVDGSLAAVDEPARLATPVSGMVIDPVRDGATFEPEVGVDGVLTGRFDGVRK